jgi:hypothetical protein
MSAECIPLLDAASTDRAGPLDSSRLRHLLTYLRRQLVPTPGSRARPETGSGTQRLELPVTYRCCLRSMLECDVSSVAVLFSSASSREAADSYRGDHRCGFGVLVGPLRHRLRTSRHSVHLGRPATEGLARPLLSTMLAEQVPTTDPDSAGRPILRPAYPSPISAGGASGLTPRNVAGRRRCRRAPGRIVGTSLRP